MPQPPAYTRSFSYTDFAASYPSTPAPGNIFDAEFDAISATAKGILANLVKIQRDDGALKNQVVTIDSLSPAVMLALGAGVIWLPRGAWATATAYAISDVVSVATASYVCSAPHTSAALFATDLAAGRWTKLYDDAGSVPGDGTVTAAKIAAGAVTAAAIGFTGLDLSGSIRAATGLQAGTAPLGGLLHAKAPTGDALAKVERTTDAQGAVGYRWVGVAANWEMSMASGANLLNTWRNGVLVQSLTAIGGLDQSGAIRAIDGALPAVGSGIALTYSGGIGYLDAYNYDATAWLPLKVRGSTVKLTAGAVDVVSVSATGVDITGTAKRGGVDLGWLDIPQNNQNGAYTFALSDRGKHIFSQFASGQTWIIPAFADVAFPNSSTIALVNDGINPITVSPAAGVTLIQAGTGSSGARTLASNGMATLLNVGTNRWYISGAGVA